MSELDQFVGLAYVENLIIEPQTAERDELLSKGIELIPNKLILRGFEKTDLEYREKWRLSQPSHHQGLTLVLELSNVSTKILRNDDNQIHRAITALRLFKAGRVNIDGIIVYHPNPEWAGSYITGFPVQWFPTYHLHISEIDDFVELFNVVKYIDYEKNPAYRIAINRFESTYRSKLVDDRIIDYCISFDALFGNQRIRGRGNHIGMACGNLLAGLKQEKDLILETIQDLFKIRNNVVHGDPMDKDIENKFNEFPYDAVEEYLRRSLVTLLPNET